MESNKGLSNRQLVRTPRLWQTRDNYKNKRVGTMTPRKTLLLCSCDKTQSLDAKALKRVAGAEQAIQVDQLCGNEMPVAVEHLGATN